MTPSHQILRLAACHDSVCVGNLSDDISHELGLLVDSGDVEVHVDGDELSWYRLTSSGRARLYDLNLAGIAEYTAID